MTLAFRERARRAIADPQLQRLLDQNADAVAYATLQYAMNTSDVNGVRGKGNFRLDPPPGPDPAAAQTE